MWSSWTESAKASLQQAVDKAGEALEKTGDVLTEAATTQKHRKDKNAEKKEGDAGEGSTNTTSGTQQGGVGSSEGLYKNFQLGWSSVVESTKVGLQKASQVVEEQQSKIQLAMKEAQNEANGIVRPRPLHLPLDVAALQDAQVVYLTDRILTLSHPAMASASDGEITAERKLAAVGHLLQKRHAGRFMIWNLSEVDYSHAASSIFEDQVLNYSFPGSPSPPLGLLLKLLMSMESWLKADDRNVAVVHCLTGKGRSSTVVAAFLCWMQQAGFGSDMVEALDYIAQCKQIDATELTIPSQRRYASYFQNMLENLRPNQPPLLLARVIMSVSPKFARGPGKEGWDESQMWGCAPYLQLFKGGKLEFTVPASSAQTEQSKTQSEADTEGSIGESKPSLTFCHAGDGRISFDVNQIVQGDVLVRCRHLTARKQRVSMFRAAFHTGYVGGTVLRLTKSQLDGACNDHERFSDDFYVDIIFEKIDAEKASQMIKEQQEKLAKENEEHVEVSSTKSDIVTATEYDTMLDRDSRFWQVIAKRKEEHEAQTKKQEEGGKSSDGDKTDQSPENDVNTWGPTVGRRRPLEKDSVSNVSNQDEAKSAAKESSFAFSIGGEFDFMPAESPQKPEKKVKKPDSLLEALTGAIDDYDDDDAENPDDDIHEVVFFREEDDTKQTENDLSESTAEIDNTKPVEKEEEEEGDVNSTDPIQDSVKSVDCPPETANAENVESFITEKLSLDDDELALLAAGIDGLEADDSDDEDLADLENLLTAGKK